MDGGVWEIEEEEVVAAKNVDHRINVPTSLESTAAASTGEDVYVAVGKKSSSISALWWALKHIVKPSSFVYLVHVFPEVHRIPTPLCNAVGMLPKSQVSAEQVESFMSQERTRRDLLQKFLNLCHASKVQGDTLLLESELVAKAVFELIPLLRVKKVIGGATKSSMRKLKKGSSKAEQIYKSAPDYCEVKIICDGKEVAMTDWMTIPSPHSDPSHGKKKDNEQENKNSVSCICFMRKFM